MRPHRRQPTRLPRPWDSPGENTGVGCHFLPQCMEVKSESEVTQLCEWLQSLKSLSDPMDCSLPGFSIHGIFQAGVLAGSNSWGLHRIGGPSIAIWGRLLSPQPTRAGWGRLCGVHNKGEPWNPFAKLTHIQLFVSRLLISFQMAFTGE